MAGRRAALALSAILVLAVLARLLPAYMSGSLFSTDVWPLYRDTRVLLENSQARIWEDKLFDGYNNHWPGVILSAAVSAAVLGLSARGVYMYLYTAALAAGMMVAFYAFARRILARSSSTLSLLVLGFTPSLLVFTSSPLKEVYAYPMLFALLALALRALEEPLAARGLALAAVLSLGMAVSHHLASFMAAGFTAGLAYALLACSLKGLRLAAPGAGARLLLLAALEALVFAAYYTLYGRYGLQLPLGLRDAALYLVYAAVIYGGFLVFAGRVSPAAAVLPVIPVMAYILAFRGSVAAMIGVRMSSSHILPYAAPIAAALTLVAFIRDRLLGALEAALGLFIALNTAFALFGSPGVSSIIHRFLDYLVPMLALLVGYLWGRGGGGVRLLAAAVAAASLASGLLVSVNIVSYRDKVSYTWYYPLCETRGFDTVFAYASRNLTLVGDTKVYYYGLMERNVDSRDVPAMLLQGGAPRPGKLYIVYYENYRIGYKFFHSIYRLGGLFSREGYSRVYDNFWVQAYLYGGGVDPRA